MSPNKARQLVAPPAAAPTFSTKRREVLSTHFSNKWKDNSIISERTMMAIRYKVIWIPIETVVVVVVVVVDGV